MVDTAQLVHHVVKLWRQKHPSELPSPIGDKASIQEAVAELFGSKLIQVVGHDAGIAFPDTKDKSLRQLLETGFLKLDKTPTHRVVMLDSRDGFDYTYAVFSQSDVLQFVAGHVGQCLPAGNYAWSGGSEQLDQRCSSARWRSSPSWKRPEITGLCRQRWQAVARSVSHNGRALV